MLPDIIHRSRDPHVGITAEQATIVLRLSASGATEEACQAAMEPIAAAIRQHLGKLVFGEEDDELQDAVIRLLRQKGKTLATAEWGTAGLVADWLGDVADAPGFYLGGVVVQSEAAAKRMLDVSPDPSGARAEGHQRLAARMASACRERLGADYGLAVGPLPKFDPAASDPKPVFFALATAAGVSTRSMPFSAHPALLKALCGKNALDMLRLAIMA
jgi:nicotinamide-nucleotide amidase